MKNNYFNAVTCDLIKDEAFIPVKDSEGNFVISELVRAFSRSITNSYCIFELFDGDRLPAAWIEERIGSNVRWLEQAGISGPRGVLLILEVFVFSGKPDMEKLEIISRHQSTAIQDRRHLACITVTMEDSGILREGSLPVSIGGIERILRKRLQGDLSAFETLPDMNTLLKQVNPELEMGSANSKPIGTYVFLGINIAIWLLGQLMKMTFGTDYLTEWGIKFAPLIIQGEYWRLITPMFLHANAMHIFANSYSLLIFGQIVEREFGTKKFILIYMIAGFMGNIASFTFSNAPSLGASGAVLGIGGAMILVWRKRSRGYFKYSGQNFALVVMVGINILYGFTNQGIDNFAHIGGVIGGYLSAYLTGFKGSNIKLGQRLAAGIGILLLATVGIAAGFFIWSGRVG